MVVASVLAIVDGSTGRAAHWRLCSAGRLPCRAAAMARLVVSLRCCRCSPAWSSARLAPAVADRWQSRSAAGDGAAGRRRRRHSDRRAAVRAGPRRQWHARSPGRVSRLAGLSIGHLLGGPAPTIRVVLAFSSASRHPAHCAGDCQGQFPGRAGPGSDDSPVPARRRDGRNGVHGLAPAARPAAVVDRVTDWCGFRLAARRRGRRSGIRDGTWTCPPAPGTARQAGSGMQ